ncbi:aldo/keto reductase [Amycolatopsis sp. DG1A-15b]|uniref:aldo/keto reductase n=1 Tax=Amycolatopsis sp. DG1A-15b TaxID=3052846 RepID=UPI00255BC6A6|nr:aldo/keto reductase [Amycolatopsis sp. DG1A-15b]WIX85824.1 aldo/keto reductase [Amycolatopsis sp. DG1A-15b]
MPEMSRPSFPRFVDLAPGVRMPRLGLGTWRLRGDLLRGVLDQAFAAGYRLVDTASYYDNESSVGQAVTHCGLSREALFVTTKIRGRDQGRESAVTGCELSLRRLNLDYVDLLLIHWPQPMNDQYCETWEALIELRERGLVRAIGVSNFNPTHIDRIICATGVTPAVNQIQCNPAVQNRTMRVYNHSCRIHTQAWEPLGTTGNVLVEPSVVSIAEQVGRTPAQVVLRWQLQLGNSAVPKSATPRRLHENFDVFDWELPADLHAELDRLDNGGSDRADPDVQIVD